MSRMSSFVTVASLAAVSVLAFDSGAAITVQDRVRENAPNQYVITNPGNSGVVVLGFLSRRDGNVTGVIGSDSPIQGDGPPPIWRSVDFTGGFNSRDTWEDQFFVDSYTPSLSQFYGLDWDVVAPDEGQTLTAYFLDYANGDPFGTPFFIEPDDANDPGETFYALQYNSNLNRAMRGASTELLLITADLSGGLGDPADQPGGYGFVAIDGAFGIPTPGSMALLTLGSASALRRRR
ncbi:MAG: hypothetical protein AAGG07_08990 [Planctomycetota bacterium]